jgi:hypothetical protein
MTVAQLITELNKYAPDLTVRYEYDTGHSYPTFVGVALHRDSYNEELGEFVCLYEGRI